ncbi:hypothetical protein HK405_006486 [Cladochytrium tenue]|nr:hypothetical protein HK405_006486 [Cladochytrium tenue]
MVKAKSKNTVGLGRTLVRSRFKAPAAGVRFKENPDGSVVRHTTDFADASSKMNSITQENDLEAFLSTATLAGTDLEEEKGLLMTPYERNIEVWRQMWRVIERSDLVVQIVDARNPLMFRSADLETYVKETDARKGNLLLINKADMLTAQQRIFWADYFDKIGIRYTFFSAALARRRLAEAELLQREAKERALEEEERAKIEEALKDLALNSHQAGASTSGIIEDDSEEDEDDVDDSSEEVSEEAVISDENSSDYEDEVDAESAEYLAQGSTNSQRSKKSVLASIPADDSIIEEVRFGISASTAWMMAAPIKTDPRIEIVGCDELLDMFARECPEPLRSGEKKRTIGFVGYPNVGKSSSLNALAGTKRVTVSSTPGKTKHFQTIHLDDTTVLCDCPGLVFPSFATTKAEMVVNGVLPIDQLREYTGPAALVAQRIPRHALEAIYGIRIRTLDAEGNIDPNGVVTGEDLCQAYATARGFKKAGQGNPDEARAARVILKDYVQGKLLFCHPPPFDGLDGTAFNRETYSGTEFKRRAARRQQQTHEAAWGPASAATSINAGNADNIDRALEDRSVDATFFRGEVSSGGTGSMARTAGRFGVAGFTRPMMFPHHVGAAASAGTAAPVASAAALEAGGSRAKGKGKARAVAVEPEQPLVTAPPGMGRGLEAAASKKHFKPRRGKQRDRWTADGRAD